MDRAIVNVANYELYIKTLQSDKFSCCKMMTKMMINILIIIYIYIDSNDYQSTAGIG